jgi:hypothetical protein
MRTYCAFCDPSGGSSDSMTLAIAHVSVLKRCVLDGFWERRPPFSPASVTEEFASVLKSYGIAAVTGDRYSGEWVRESFRTCGITYTPSELTKSEIYSTFVVLVNSGRVKMPAEKRLRVQFQSLERRLSRTSKDLIDHASGAHDDIANAVAGALVLAASGASASREPWVEVMTFSDENLAPSDPGPERWWKRL